MQDQLDPKELRRYTTHLQMPEIGEEGQKKLKSSRVLIIGVGGLGSTVMQYLGAAGVGILGIIDDAHITEDNLHRQTLYGWKDLGKLKTIIARERMAGFNPMIRIHPVNLRVDAKNIARVISDYELVVDACNSLESNLLINDACIGHKIPWVYASVQNFLARLTVFNYHEGPTLRCLMASHPEEVGQEDDASRKGMGMMLGLAGCYQAIQAIKCILNLELQLSGKLLQMDLMNDRFNFVTFKRKREHLEI